MAQTDTRSAAQGKMPSWVGWTLATTIGIALGMTVSAYVVNATLRPMAPVLTGLLNVFLYGSVTGLVLGLVQFAVMRGGPVPFARWIAASVLGMGVGMVLSAIIGRTLGAMLEPDQDAVLGEALAAILNSLVFILPVAVAQRMAFGPYLARPMRWMILTLIGGMLGSLSAAVGVGWLELPLLTAASTTSIGALLGLFVGVFQGLGFRQVNSQAST
jgi:hypothetical protein